jgi:pyroglutamyl-peptidase
MYAADPVQAIDGCGRFAGECPHHAQQPDMQALVTAFEPFDGDDVNASLAAAQRLPARIGQLTIATATLPTSYARAHGALEAALERTQPDIVLCVGEAGDRADLNVEYAALNVQDARIPDNDGAQPAGIPIVADGPPAYFATLPVRECVAALRSAGLPATVSYSAGTFVCNHVFYRLMHLAGRSARTMHCGFLHVPLLPQQAARRNTPHAMALDDIVRGIVIVLQTCATHRRSPV